MHAVFQRDRPTSVGAIQRGQTIRNQPHCINGKSQRSQSSSEDDRCFCRRCSRAKPDRSYSLWPKPVPFRRSGTTRLTSSSPWWTLRSGRTGCNRTLLDLAARPCRRSSRSEPEFKNDGCAFDSTCRVIPTVIGTRFFFLLLFITRGNMGHWESLKISQIIVLTTKISVYGIYNI